MSAVEYSLIFLSIVISYVVTVAMGDWGKLIKHYDFKNFSINYLLWSLFLFIYLLFIWFWTFTYHLPYLDSFFWFTLIMVRPLLIYFCFEVLVPSNREDFNYDKHFFIVRRKFFYLITILWSYEIFLELLMGHDLMTTRGILYLIIIPISISLIIIKNKSYIRIATIISFVIMIAFFILQMLDQYWNS
jgi:hypothetical protein